MLNFNVIIATTDLSEYSLRALPYAVGLAERFDAQLKLVCVSEPAIQVADVAFVGIDPVLNRRQHVAAVRDALTKIVSGLPETLDVEPKVLEGVAVDRIVEYAKEINADLIISCTHGRTGLSHVLMGSTAEALVRRSPCPVLTLKQPMMVAAVQHGA
ncbi:MAG TPA: universal stress protein [Candidatus Krumholzibacteria bacterium]|nr:universal stress protein [Candidatus Krumholzibacteria bacterium]